MSFSFKGFPFFAGFVAFLGTLASAATINVDIGKEYQRNHRQECRLSLGLHQWRRAYAAPHPYRPGRHHI